MNEYLYFVELTGSEFVELYSEVRVAIERAKSDPEHRSALEKLLERLCEADVARVPVREG